MEQPYFSIITASLNYAESIEETIISIKNQSYTDYEHIIIDGGSIDNTLEIIKSHSTDYNLQYISESDQGISDAMNKGIKLACGKYVLFIQADDYLLNKNVLHTAHEFLSNHDADIYTFPIYIRTLELNFKLFSPFKHYKFYYKLKSCFRSQGTFIDRKLFKSVGLFNNEFKIFMDYDFYYRALLQNIEVKIGKTPISVMNQTGISNRPHLQSIRINEEFRAQEINEKKLSWILIRKIFRTFYIPYRYIKNLKYKN